MTAISCASVQSDQHRRYTLLTISTVMILNFRTGRSWQTVQIGSRSSLIMVLNLYVFDKIPSGLVSSFEF